MQCPILQPCRPELSRRRSRKSTRRLQSCNMGYQLFEASALFQQHADVWCGERKFGADSPVAINTTGRLWPQNGWADLTDARPHRNSFFPRICTGRTPPPLGRHLASLASAFRCEDARSIHHECGYEGSRYCHRPLCSSSHCDVWRWHRVNLGLSSPSATDSNFLRTRRLRRRR